MSLAIYKYVIGNLPGEFHVSMPKGAQIVHCAKQRENICLWAIIDKKEIQHYTRLFLILGTGQQFDQKDFDKMKYIATLDVGIFVWHVFEWINRN